MEAKHIRKYRGGKPDFEHLLRLSRSKPVRVHYGHREPVLMLHVQWLKRKLPREVMNEFDRAIPYGRAVRRVLAQWRPDLLAASLMKQRSPRTKKKEKHAKRKKNPRRD
jgi:hypothetical protein